MIEALPDNIDVTYAGEVHPSNISFELSQHDLFFFPTRGENYGHVIYEALLAGLPVLISDQTPWDELEKYGVGWAFPLKNVPAFANKINYVACLTAHELLNIRRKSVVYAQEKAKDEKALLDNIELFRSVVYVLSNEF